MNTPTKLTTAELDAQLLRAEPSTTPEAAALRSTLADLRSTCLLAADFRLPAPRPDAKPSHATLVPRWAMVTATAGLAIALAVPIALHTSHSAPPAPVANTARPQSASGISVEDAELLADIQTDLSASVPASLQPLATSSSRSTTSNK